MTSDRYFTIATLPLIKQRQVIVKKPIMEYEFISRKDRKRYIEFAQQAWLLGLHEDGYIRDQLQSIWIWGDSANDHICVGRFDFIVARADGAIVGIILHENKVSVIDTYVIPSWRRRGIASGMVEALRYYVGDSKVLCGWTGTSGDAWRSYYESNFILHLDQMAPMELVEQYGDKETATAAFFKSLKLKLSAAYRKHKSGK